jgi:death on curing protein
MTAFGMDAYPTPSEKAAALAESIVHNHPFNDGNHRTALAAIHAVLGLFERGLVAPSNSQKETILAVEGGRMTLEEFAKWIENNSVLRVRSA